MDHSIVCKSELLENQKHQVFVMNSPSRSATFLCVELVFTTFSNRSKARFPMFSSPTSIRAALLGKDGNASALSSSKKARLVEALSLAIESGVGISRSVVSRGSSNFESPSQIGEILQLLVVLEEDDL